MVHPFLMDLAFEMEGWRLVRAQDVLWESTFHLKAEIYFQDDAQAKNLDGTFHLCLEMEKFPLALQVMLEQNLKAALI